MGPFIPISLIHPCLSLTVVLLVLQFVLVGCKEFCAAVKSQECHLQGQCDAQLGNLYVLKDLSFVVGHHILIFALVTLSGDLNLSVPRCQLVQL